jgi:hypothetical protein
MKNANWPASALAKFRFFLLLFLFDTRQQKGFGSNFYQGVATNNLPWPGGIVPYLFDTNVSTIEQAIYLAGMKEWELAANVHFVPYTWDLQLAEI